MTDNVRSGTAQEVSDSDRLWRVLMSTNGTLVITLVTTKVPHVDCYFWYQTTTFGYIIDRVWPETAQEVSDFNMILTVCGGRWCTQMSPDFVIRSAILHKYCDRIDVKSVSFLRLNKQHWNKTTPPFFLREIILRESSRRCRITKYYRNAF